MKTFREATILATALLLASAAPAAAGHYGDNTGPGWGAVAGAGVLGFLGGLATQPQQPAVIVVVPQAAPTPAPAPAPIAAPALNVWCPSARQWYPLVRSCQMEWQITLPASGRPVAHMLCVASQQYYPIARDCPGGWVPVQITGEPATTLAANPPPTIQQPHYWWCLASRQWYPDVQTCAGPWSR